MRRIFIATEVTHLPWTGRSELFWVGLADEGGDSFSAVNSDVDLSTSSPFVQIHVAPLIPVHEARMRTDELRAAVRHFCRQVTEFWVWPPSAADLQAHGFATGDASILRDSYADRDLRLLRKLAGKTAGAWLRCHDLHEYAADADVPARPAVHNPRNDALWNRDVFVAIALVRSS